VLCGFRASPFCSSGVPTLTRSTNVNTKIDLVGARRRGLAMG
jgi:hypothetical protein